MSETRHTKVLIIGSGPAGYTAGVYAARAMLEPVLVQGIEPGGQLTTTTEVENWPGDTQVQGPDLMIRMEAHAREMGCDIVGDIISSLDLSKRPFTAQSDSGTVYTADAVILCTGARAKWLGLPSEEKFKGFGVSACATRPVPPAMGSFIAAKKSWLWAAAIRLWKRRFSSPTLPQRSRWYTAAMSCVARKSLKIV